jgi:HPt (histidine-containing phosphotransfer) domain-containing protein
MSDATDKTTALLAKLWIKIQPIVEDRLTALDRASVAAAQGSLSDELRKEAQSNAHKLAGALGMYGFDEGTRISRELEHLLERGIPEPGRLTALVAELRASLTPNS